MPQTSSREPLSLFEKKRQLYENQKNLLDTFLSHGAISKAQYDKSLGDMTEKMGISNNEPIAGGIHDRS